MFGSGYPGGVYVLRIQANESLVLEVGRFQQGKPLFFPAGEYLYIGSALAAKGATSLAGRLLRHASRGKQQPPHSIQVAMLSVFTASGLGSGLVLPSSKRCFWHVDYLLDQPAVDLRQVFVLRTDQPLERALAHRLAADENMFVVAKGLGARDHPGGTHLLGVKEPADWWPALPERLNTFLLENGGGQQRRPEGTRLPP
jgi:Uri superfamily endonuclease